MYINVCILTGIFYSSFLPKCTYHSIIASKFSLDKLLFKIKGGGGDVGGGGGGGDLFSPSSFIISAKEIDVAAASFASRPPYILLHRRAPA